jgi:hypothetical protein
MFSNTYRPSISGFGSNWFQYWPADVVSPVPRQAPTSLVFIPLIRFF